MGNIYTYRLDIGGRRAEAIYTSKADAEREHKKDSKYKSRKVGMIIEKVTPYIVPVK